MNKIKEYIKNISKDIKDIFKKYSFTFILMYIITLIMIIAGFEPEHIEEFYTVMILTNILVFVVDSIFKFKWYRIPMYIGVFGISIIAKELIFSGNFTGKQGLVIAGMYLSAVIIAIYKIIKDSEITIPQFLSKAFNNSIVLGIVNSVIHMGVMFIVLITSLLLLKDEEFEIFTKAEIFLAGFIFIPSIILSIVNVRRKVLKLVQILICYIILPIVIIAELVIYIYFIKILVLREIPSNVIFSIIAGLFAFAGPTWIMISNFKDENKYISVNTKLIPYSFIPFICMQIYAVGIRIVQMGFTPERYLGVMLVLFEIITIILTLAKKQKYLDKIILSLVAFALVIMCIPRINVIDFSWNSQLNRLKAVYKENTNFEELSQKEKDKANGAYKYLKNDEEGKKHIPEYIDESKFKENDRRVIQDKVEHDYKKINYQSYDDVISVEGYNKLQPVDFQRSSYREGLKLNDIDIYEITDYRFNDEEMYNSIINFIKEAMEKENLDNDTIILDENNTLKITKFNIRYYEDNYEIENINIKGYLLMK